MFVAISHHRAPHLRTTVLQTDGPQSRSLCEMVTLRSVFENFDSKTPQCSSIQPGTHALCGSLEDVIFWLARWSHKLEATPTGISESEICPDEDPDTAALEEERGPLGHRHLKDRGQETASYHSLWT